MEMEKEVALRERADKTHLAQYHSVLFSTTGDGQWPTPNRFGELPVEGEAKARTRSSAEGARFKPLKLLGIN